MRGENIAKIGTLISFTLKGEFFIIPLERGKLRRAAIYPK
jgi:hypothetical protein